MSAGQLVATTSLVVAMVAGFVTGTQSTFTDSGTQLVADKLPQAERHWVGNGNPITIAFAGDTHFQNPIRTQLLANPGDLLSHVSPVLAKADLTIVNLETAITDRGTPAPKTFVFRDPIEGLDALNAAGVDVVSAANNHGLDYGLTGLEDTLAAAQATGVDIIGIGRNEQEAYAPYVTEIRGQRIGILAGSHVIDPALEAAWTAGPDQPGMANAMIERMDEAVRELRPQVDTLVVFPHWGIETQSCPSAYQRQFVDRMYNAGADMVIGSHTHTLLGAGFHKDMFVGYGLGNFVFYAASGPYGESGILTVTATGRKVTDYNWQPAQIRNGVPQLLSGNSAASAQQAWQQLRECTSLTAESAASTDQR